VSRGQFGGLDLWDLLIHGVVTVGAMIALSGIFHPNEEIGIGFGLLLGGASLGIRRFIAIRNLPGGGAGQEGSVNTGEVLGDLDERLRALEDQGVRIADLEERLDFAERLLASQEQKGAPLGPARPAPPPH
jgi:hypothetical protein